MPNVTNALQPIVTAHMAPDARAVIESVRRNTPFPYLVDAKLGSTEQAPLLDAETAARVDTPLHTIAGKWKEVLQLLCETDAQQGSPLHSIARRANATITSAAILNRHNRRPPLYSETTIAAFIQLGVAAPEDSPLIRAAGHVVPPPVFPLNHDLAPIVSDIAAHMARTHEPQSVEQILQSLEHRRGLLAKWPDLNPTLFIQRMTDIQPDAKGAYRPEQPWSRFISAQQLVANTVLRIFARDRAPCTTDYLVSETERMVGQFLPEGYNTLVAVRAAIAKSDDISWQGPCTFGLREWGTAVEPQHVAGGRGSTGDMIYAFLLRHGPTEVENVIEHVQQNCSAKRRTIQEAINHDRGNRFIRISDQKIAANPVPDEQNGTSASLVVVPDQRECKPAPVLRESELAWLTRYVQELDELTPPLPSQVAITGPRAAGFAQAGDTLEITVVADPCHSPNLEHRIAASVAAATKAVPCVQPNIKIQSCEQWAEQQAGKAAIEHRNVWLPPAGSPWEDLP